MNRPLLQVIGPPALSPERRWDAGLSRTGYSTLSWVATPWFKLNFWKPHRLSFWRWLVPDVVLISIGGPR